MYLDAKDILSFLCSHKIFSLTKTREYPFIEWRGEIEDKYLVIRYASSVLYIGLADTDSEAISNINFIVSGLSSNIYEIADYCRFELPKNYVEFY